MNFLITSYIYPLSEPVILSRQFNFYLDNPQTEEEIDYVKKRLIEAYDSGYDFRFPIYSDEPIVTVEDLLFKFRDNFGGLDACVREFFKLYDRESVFEFVARMWVVARYDDEGESLRLKEAHKQMLEAGQVGFFLLEDEHPILKNSQKLADYCALLALLINTEGKDYFGRELILDPYQEISSRPVTKVWEHFLMFGIASQQDMDGERGNINEPLRWIFLPYILEDLRKTCQLLDKAFIDGCEEKLLYMGSILKITSHDAREGKVRLVMLTSIIELLLTHNPNFNRFNVEDSINKQFQLKASILIYLNDKGADINSIQKRLKTIYEQRSNVAHGNFDATNKYIRNLSKKEGEEEYFDTLLVDLYSYIRSILEQYLRDRTFVDFLKNN